MKEDKSAFTRNLERYPLLMSEFALEIYTVLGLFILIRRYWVLHGITLVILAHIADIFFAWFIHVKEAREVRLFKSWLLWWIRHGLDFAEKTIGGDFMHRLVFSNGISIWKGFGQDYTLNWIGDAAKKGRTNFLNRAREQLNQMPTN